MENQNTPTSDSLFDLALDDNAKQTLKGAAVIGGIAAIIGLVKAGLDVVSHFATKNEVIDGFEEYQKPNAGANAFSMIGMVIGLLIAFLLFYFVNKFSRLAKTGLDGNNQQQVNEGLSNLSSYFKTVGVLTIIVLCLFFLGLLALLAGTAGSL